SRTSCSSAVTAAATSKATVSSARIAVPHCTLRRSSSPGPADARHADRRVPLAVRERDTGRERRLSDEAIRGGSRRPRGGGGGGGRRGLGGRDRRAGRTGKWRARAGAGENRRDR